MMSFDDNYIAAGKAATNLKIVALSAAYDFSPKSLQKTKILGNYSIKPINLK